MSGNPHAKLREWGAQALTALVKSAMKARTGIGESVCWLLALAFTFLLIRQFISFTLYMYVHEEIFLISAMQIPPHFTFLVHLTSCIWLQKRQQIILSPLSSMSEIKYTDVRRKQIECLVNVLRSAGQQLTSDQWPTVIEIVRAVVGGKLKLVQLSSVNLT